MKNADYWKLRFSQLEQSSFTSAAQTKAFIDEQYKVATAEIEKQISTWYARFAKNNNISMAEARKMLSTSDLKELKWDINEYIKYGHENGLNVDWSKELENASAKFHISKLEALKLQTEMTCNKLFGKQIDSVTSLLKDTYLDGYYHSAFEIQHGLNVGWNIAAIDENKLSKIMGKPWTTDGLNFSDRIWANRESLIAETHKQLTQDILLGRSPDKSINAIAKKFNTSKSKAGRLVMTESAYFSSEAQKDCFKDLDVEQFEIIGTLDDETCATCAAMDGQVFDMKDFESGTTAPPFHPWCRCCTAPYFDDNFTERAARDADGKTYYIPDNIKYPEWKEKFVDGDDLTGFDVYEQNGVTHYTKHTEPEPVKPKKEYLTKKKLQANIANAEVEIEDLQSQFQQKSGGWTYEEADVAIQQYSSVQDETAKELKDIKNQVETIEQQKAEWQEKLNEKLVKEQKKALTKQQIELQQQIDDFEIETYSGIWKDDVTTLDWNVKQYSIDAKKKYYENKFITETDTDLMKKYQDLYKQLDDFDKKGKSYYEIQAELKKVQADLTNLNKNGIINSKELEAFSDERKNNALWAKSVKEADDELRGVCGQVWRNATATEKNAIYDYTTSYSKFNEPLRGIEYGTNKFLGVGNVNLDEIGVKYKGFKKGQVKKEIDAMTSIIEKSSYSIDVWVQRGCDYNGMDKFFGIDANDFYLPESELANKLIGTTPTEYGFFSTGVSKGEGFSHKPIIMNVYAPSGTKMMYAEPFSAFGNGSGKQWDGISKQSSFGSEAEMIFQRDTTFKITKVEKNNGKIYIDMEVINQEVH